VVVRLLDHTYALHQGSLRSGQPRLVEQLGHFQSACRDVARRVGLVPITAAAAEPFDSQRHQLVDNNAKPPSGAVIAETIATGYTFQGKMVRPVLVRLQEATTVIESQNAKTAAPASAASAPAEKPAPATVK